MCAGMRRLVVLASFALAASCVRPPDLTMPTGDGPRGPDDPDAWAKAYDDPSRDAWQLPDEVIRALALPPDASLADLGAATGYFTVRFARALPKGTVYGVDVESTMVDFLKKRAAAEHLGNVVPVLAAYDDAKIPAPVDVVLVVDTFHFLEDRPAYFRRLMASLKPSGRVAIIDFTKKSAMGPPLEAKVGPEVVEQELVEAGYAKAATFAFLPEQYFLVFQRP